MTADGWLSEWWYQLGGTAPHGYVTPVRDSHRAQGVVPAVRVVADVGVVVVVVTAVVIVGGGGSGGGPSQPASTSHSQFEDKFGRW